jgi:hypothetical protein
MASAIVRRGRMVKSVEESLDNNDERRHKELFRNGINENSL